MGTIFQLGNSSQRGSGRRDFDVARFDNFQETYHMATTPQDALHQVHTATNDVLEGYRTMIDRAEPEIQEIVLELTAMHTRHASDLKARLLTLGHTGEDDTSFRGTMNKVAVTKSRLPCGTGSLDWTKLHWTPWNAVRRLFWISMMMQCRTGR